MFGYRKFCLRTKLAQINTIDELGFPGIRLKLSSLVATTLSLEVF